MSALKSWIQLPVNIKRLLPESIWFLVIYSCAIYLLKYRKFLHWFKFEVCAIPVEFVVEKPLAGSMESNVSVAIGVASKRFVPWAKCLPQALAAETMLRRRGISSIVCIGVNPIKEALVSHAWLLAGLKVVTGLKGIENCRAIVGYARKVT